MNRLSFSLISLCFLSLFSLPATEGASILPSSRLLSRSHSRFRTLTCTPPTLSSLSLLDLPWYSSQQETLEFNPVNFDPNVNSYFTTRPGSDSYSFLRILPGTSNPSNAVISFQLNGNQLDPNPIPSLDFPLVPGTNTLELLLSNGNGCTNLYTILIYEAPLGPEELQPPFPDCATALNTQINNFTVGVEKAGSNDVTPLVVMPPYDPNGSPFYISYTGTENYAGGSIVFTPSFNTGGWFRYSINRQPWIYGGASGDTITGPLVEGSNLIQFDVIQPAPCGDYIAEYSETIYQSPVPGEIIFGCDEVNELPSVTFNFIPWLKNTVIPLPISLTSGVYDYTLSRSFSNGILQFSTPPQPLGVDTNVYLNGKIVEPHPLPAGTTLDLPLLSGTNVIQVNTVQGDCVTSYNFTIKDTGDDHCPCTAPNVQVEISSVSLAVVDAGGRVYPITITPDWDGITKNFYVSYGGSTHDLANGQIKLMINSITPTSWFRYAFNHGIWIYGNPSGALIAPLLPGTNLIQLDVLQSYSCGDYIAEYSITIYPGQNPTPSDGEEIITCDPLQLSGLNFNFIPWSTNTIIPLVPNFDAGTYDYQLSRSVSHGVYQLSTTAALAGAEIDVFYNGALVDPHPLPSGQALDLVVGAGANTIRIDVTQGNCTTSYDFTIADTGSDNAACSDNSPVQISDVKLSLIDVNNNILPLSLTPAWDGLNKWFYIAYIGAQNVDGGKISFEVTDATPNLWIRTAFNHGKFMYGGEVGTPIIADLVSGSNLIQLNALQLYSCGGYTAAYSITIYQGEAPN